MLNIRKERDSDIEEVFGINVRAFDTDAEAKLVDRLRSSGVFYISLIAEENSHIVGHILFTPVELTGNPQGLRLMGLAPMAVLPEYQNRGIGSRLVEAGLKRCKDENIDAVFVLGHPDYYPRFGFLPSVRFGIKSQYEVPDELFMAVELNKGILSKNQGIIRYRKEFEGL